VSQAADEGAELTEAVGAVETPRRSQNEWRTTESSGGASWVCAQNERESKGVRLGAQLAKGSE
jgi:hypothetical protein